MAKLGDDDSNDAVVESKSESVWIIVSYSHYRYLDYAHLSTTALMQDNYNKRGSSMYWIDSVVMLCSHYCLP